MDSRGVRLLHAAAGSRGSRQCHGVVYVCASTLWHGPTCDAHGPIPCHPSCPSFPLLYLSRWPARPLPPKLSSSLCPEFPLPYLHPRYPHLSLWLPRSRSTTITPCGPSPLPPTPFGPAGPAPLPACPPTCPAGCPGPAVSCPAPPPPASGQPAQTPARQPPCTWPGGKQGGWAAGWGGSQVLHGTSKVWHAKIGTCSRLITSRTGPAEYVSATATTEAMAAAKRCSWPGARPPH